MEKTYIDKLAWIHIVDKRILSTLSEGKDTWYIPGGKREGDESDQVALIREIKEELTVDLIPETVTHIGTYEAQAHGKPAGTVVRMTCYTGAYQGAIAPAAEIAEITWHTHADKSVTSPVDQIIYDDLKLRDLIE